MSIAQYLMSTECTYNPLLCMDLIIPNIDDIDNSILMRLKQMGLKHIDDINYTLTYRANEHTLADIPITII